MKLGFAWYKKDQWSKWLKIREDRSRLENTFDEWESIATKHFLELISQKIDVQKIIVDIDIFKDWCKSHSKKSMPNLFLHLFLKKFESLI